MIQSRIFQQRFFCVILPLVAALGVAAFLRNAYSFIVGTVKQQALAGISDFANLIIRNTCYQHYKELAGFTHELADFTHSKFEAPAIRNSSFQQVRDLPNFKVFWNEGSLYFESFKSGKYSLTASEYIPFPVVAASCNKFSKISFGGIRIA